MTDTSGFSRDKKEFKELLISDVLVIVRCISIKAMFLLLFGLVCFFPIRAPLVLEINMTDDELLLSRDS